MDNKHVFLETIPDEFRAVELNHGVNGTCYKTADGDVFKEYFVHGVYDDITELLLSIKCPGFCMPNQLIFKGNELTSENYVGLRKDYAEGIRIGDISDSTNMEALIEALYQFEDRILEMSYEHQVDLYDLNPGNIIYNEKENTLTDIDTDVIQPFSAWFRLPDNPYFENMKLFGSDIGYKMFFPDKYNNWIINEYIKRCLIDGHARVSIVLKVIISELNKMGYPIKDYGEYKKGLTLIKK